MSSIKNLAPQLVWKYFYEITQIPRPSKREEKITDYLVGFAKEHKLPVKVDKMMNVLISKPATPGYEHLATAILQNHTDMVCEKNSDYNFDFLTQPIETYIDGEWVKAKGTTLGADNGIGASMALAILADDTIEHGPIEALFTSDEETGLTGAKNLEQGFVTGKYLLNLDSEDEGEIFIGCAGGIDTLGFFPVAYTHAPDNYYFATISISGLLGGHSGDDIHKGHANANKLLGRFLYLVSLQMPVVISEIKGGNIRNAIPREAYAVVGVEMNKKEKLRELINRFAAAAEEEFRATEASLSVAMQTEDARTEIFSPQLTQSIIMLMQAMPNGVLAMSFNMPNLVETSTNFASVKLNNNQELEFVTSQRSSLEQSKINAAYTVESIMKMAGAQVKHSEGYPGWNPNPTSEIVKVSARVYEEIFGEVPKIKAIHAGLECGLLLEKYNWLDMVSIGPTIKGAHSPDERVNIKSVENFWKYLLAILKQIPNN